MRAVRLLLALSAAFLLVGLAGRTSWIDDLKLRLDEAGKAVPASPAFAFVYPAFFGGQKAPGHAL